jgi:PadR family transcriptional regulator PadR
MARKRNSSRQTRLVLAALAVDATAWRHGLSLSREAGLSSGTLYPLLRRLADQGYLEAEWRPPEAAGRPPRHVYRLTAAGRALARERDDAADPLGPLAVQT